MYPVAPMSDVGGLKFYHDIQRGGQDTNQR
jgi:hypothetical protein